MFDIAWHLDAIGIAWLWNDISTFRYLRWTTYQAWHASNMLTSLCQVKASCLWVPVLRLAGFMRCHLLKKKHTTSNSHEQPTLVTAETHLYDTHAWAMYRLFASHRLCDWGYTTDLGASHPPCLCDLQYLSCVDTQTLTWHCWQLA